MRRLRSKGNSTKKNWLSKKALVKKLVFSKRTCNGKSRGAIVTRHKSAGLSANVHLLDYFRLIWNLRGLIVGFERDRSARCYLAVVVYPVGIMTYIRACAGQTVGDTVLAAWDAPIEVGNALPLKNIPLNVKVSCIESRPGSGGVYALAPGTFGKILAKNNLFCKIALASGSIKFLDVNCFATVGRVSNLRWRLFKLRKAGDSRSFGVRPKVRGVAKNPVDHPHGGGKGKKSKNAVPEPPWGRRQKKKKRKGFVKKIS